MRVRGTGQMLRTLSRVALIGIIGGAAAACSSDASRLSNPFSNPFESEPAATGSLPDGSLKSVPAIRTGRIQSEALSPPGASRPVAAATPAQTHAAPPATRVASTGPVGWSAQGGTQITVSQNDSLNQMSTRFGVPASAILAANGLTSASQITPGRQLVIPVYNASGMNPAAAPMTARPARAAEEKREDAKQVESKLAAKRDEAKEAAKREDAKREETKQAAKEAAKEATKRAAAEKEAERKEALARDAAARKVAEAKSRKDSASKDDEKPRHVRPGQVAKADEKKADPKAEAKAKAGAKAEAKATEAKAEAKAAAKAEAAQKLAEAKAAKEAAQKAAAAEKAEKVAAKEAPKPVAAVMPPAQAKSEPVTTSSVADATPSESFRWPAKGRVIAGYGSSGNEGINIAVPEGTPVKAAEEGTVAYAGSDVKGYGKLVLVRHANGYVSAYAHNGEIDVKPGEKVKRGQTIAKSGASGNVTSPQLHFEIRKGGSPVDPMSQLASN
ncbi:murein DD-endopeptidase MepM/ murein hydrolase activator NlpD [Methylobacterium sp. OAE515]|uniref:peptidoglycan DD-metalloendopeptidase family protein n=1 Tax=Methylobacterium sp. OAE515 TaxID=2817895 RepID=UPI00178A1715